MCVSVLSHQQIQNAPDLQQVSNSTELARRLLTTADALCNWYIYHVAYKGFDENKGGVGAHGQSDYKQLSEVTVLCRVQWL